MKRNVKNLDFLKSGEVDIILFFNLPLRANFVDYTILSMYYHI